MGLFMRTGAKNNTKVKFRGGIRLNKKYAVILHWNSFNNYILVKKDNPCLFVLLLFPILKHQTHEIAQQHFFFGMGEATLVASFVVVWHKVKFSARHMT